MAPIMGVTLLCYLEMEDIIMGNIGKNESKINNMNGVNAVRASMNDIEIKKSEENISKDAFELTQTQAKEETKKT